MQPSAYVSTKAEDEEEGSSGLMRVGDPIASEMQRSRGLTEVPGIRAGGDVRSALP